MAKRKYKNKIKNKSKNNKNKNIINIKRIGGQGGGGGGGGATSSHIPHAAHHQELDYDRIQNIFSQLHPRSTLTSETVQPPPVHQAVNITPNVSSHQNTQLTPDELRTSRIQFHVQPATLKVPLSQLSSQTAPITNTSKFKHTVKRVHVPTYNHEEVQEPDVAKIESFYEQKPEAINITNPQHESQEEILKKIYNKYKDVTPIKKVIKKAATQDYKKARYQTFKDIHKQYKELGGTQKFSQKKEDVKIFREYIANHHKL